MATEGNGAGGGGGLDGNSNALDENDGEEA